MLIKFLPDQISKHWGEIKKAIEAALPPTAGESPDKMNNILEELLLDNMQCWVNVNNETGKINGIGTTQVIVDTGTKIRNLLIYTAYSLGEETTSKDWKEGYKTICKYANSKGCQRLIGYTSIEKVVKLAEWLGGESKFRFITIPL